MEGSLKPQRGHDLLVGNCWCTRICKLLLTLWLPVAERPKANLFMLDSAAGEAAEGHFMGEA